MRKLDLMVQSCKVMRLSISCEIKLWVAYSSTAVDLPSVVVVCALSLPMQNSSAL